MLLAVAAVVSVSLRTETLGEIMLKKTWDSATLSTETLREIRGNMGQCKSKDRDFKE
jgi:hypothetical protein